MKEHQVYMNGDSGPFACKNCEYYEDKGKCNNSNIIELARDGEYGLRLKGNYAVVDPEGCSDYFEPQGIDIGDDNEEEDSEGY